MAPSRSVLTHVLLALLIGLHLVLAAPTATSALDLRAANADAKAHDQLAFPAALPDPSAAEIDALAGICPSLTVRCVLDGNWAKPVGYLGKRPFCREGIRCNQCEPVINTRECNRNFPDCMRACEAYAPIPF